MDKPIYKDEVYRATESYFGARSQGCKSAGKHFYVIPSYNDDIIFTSEGDNTFTKYSNLKERKKMTEIEAKTIEFLNDPFRSDRNGLYALLGTRGFFGATADSQRAVLNQILDEGNSVVCQDGARRFRKHMGDLLKPPYITWDNVVLSGPSHMTLSDCVAKCNEILEDSNSSVTIEIVE